jgi:uncharacterized membrane protein
MEPQYAAALIALLFAGSHVGLATRPIRSRLVARFGEWGFRSIFYAVAATSFTALITYYAGHRADGGAGPGVSLPPAARGLLAGAVVAGVTLMIASFATYAGSPYDVDRPHATRPPRGLERVTRHPFLVGMALFASAHAVLATHLIASTLMAALAGLAVGGAAHQDAKLRRLRGPGFDEYLASTSAIPFAAILSGRQRVAWRELPIVVLALGLGTALGLRYVHEHIFDHRGAWVVLVTVGGATAIMIASWRRDRRRPDPLPNEMSKGHAGRLTA